MTYSPIPLIKGLIRDTQEYLLSLNIEISQKENEILELTLKKEFTKSALIQKNTPTQVVNKFLSEHYNLTNKLTPRSFSEDTFFLIMQWGVHKASEMKKSNE